MGDQMAPYGEGVGPRSATSGVRSAFRGSGRFGPRRHGTSQATVSQAAQANDAFFVRQSPGTVAVRQDGVHLVVPGQIGDVGALDGNENPEFFDREGSTLGQIEILGVADTPMTCSLFAISNLSKVRGAAYLAVWYLTSHTMATSFEVQSVNLHTLGRLLKRLGMAWVPGTNNMAGETKDVSDAARRKCQRHHWRLREDPATGP